MGRELSRCTSTVKEGGGKCQISEVIKVAKAADDLQGYLQKC